MGETLASGRLHNKSYTQIYQQVLINLWQCRISGLRSKFEELPKHKPDIEE
jgi:hypothetical protein